MSLRREQSSDKRRITSSQEALHAEAVQLINFLRVRSNRDKLDECQFLLAGSMLERWKWNSRVISGEDLIEFLDIIRALVSEIKHAERPMDNPRESIRR